MAFRPNLQRLRHGSLASSLRRGLYCWLVGDAPWPPRFIRPDAEPAAVPPSRNIYVHLPFCQTICPHCPYNKVRYDPPLVLGYRAALLGEITTYLARDEALPVDTLYFGGGTPSLTPELVEDVIAAFRPRLEPGAQIAIEVYPLDATDALLGRLHAAGVTRISFGVESLQGAMLKRLARRYTGAQALGAIDRAKRAGFDMVDANIIFGIPGQTREEVIADLATLIEHGVDQISAYPLFTFEHTPAGQPHHSRDYARAVERVRRATQKSIAQTCRAAGLARSCVWSFTREGFSPYTTVTRTDYIGFGAGAGSLGRGRMSFNTFPVASYIAGWRRGPALVWEMTPGEARANWLYWAVYTLHVSAADYQGQFGRALEADFGRFLFLLRTTGMARRAGSDTRLTERGAIWVHRVQSLFSLSGIDRVWTVCTREAWPDAVPIF
ncbi:MAG TPA: hypothetical protein DIU07_03480 [Rhodobacteraceae bacterium]|nr:hypothetical protein [Paracoccaceae bacterium]